MAARRDEPQATAQVETDAPAPPDTKAPATTTPAPDPGPIVLRMADGSGEPVRLGALRDFHGLPLRLPGHTLTERAWGFQLRAGTSAALDLHASPKKPSSVVATLRAPSIATAEGVTVGQRFVDVKARVPDLACHGEGGEDGTSVSCTAGENVTATFHVSERYVELPDPMTLAQAEAAIGNATITELRWESDAVPEPVSTTEPGARPRHGVLPAGVYWVDDGYSPCDLDRAQELCVAPGAAVVLGTHATAKAAARAVEAVEKKGLEVGYPLVVHTDEIHARRGGERGIAIVVALLADEAEAKDWAAEHAALGTLEVLGLKGPREIAMENGTGGDGESQVVVRLRPGPTRKKGECALDGGTFSVVGAEEVRAGVYERVPARCEDGTATMIAWRETLTEAVFVRREDGAELLQVVGAECDAPEWRRWTVARGVVAGKGERVGAKGGC